MSCESYKGHLRMTFFEVHVNKFIYKKSCRSAITTKLGFTVDTNHMKAEKPSDIMRSAVWRGGILILPGPVPSRV